MSAIIDPLFSVENFLADCKISSQRTYEKLKELLHALETETTRRAARQFLSALYTFFHADQTGVDPLSVYYFTIDKLITDGNEDSTNTLLVLQMPSIFTPEDWSFTFYEGLARYPLAELQDKSIAELGCGNGWISIALAKRCLVAQIYGLDINPRAIACARLNLYLNAMNAYGDFYFDAEGKNLLQRVQFHQSDLLQYCIKNKLHLDKVIGCIPQILAPNPELFAALSEHASDASLYALSNYYTQQGYFEDQFGLGLIARAVEESIGVLKLKGKIILNLGGRPGSAVLDNLFLRRGFNITTLWQTKIAQAGDTDILPLVTIENNCAHRFEFFLSANSDESISARTALAYLHQGGTIYHSLRVVEAEIKDSSKILKILQLLQHPEYGDAHSAMDLNYEDPSLVEEKVSFLAHLSDLLLKNAAFPYEDVRGETSLRRRIAEFFRTYWRVPLTAKNFIVAPTRLAIISNLLSIFNVKKALVQTELTAQLDPEIVLEAPQHVELLCKLISALQPQMVVTSLSEYEIKGQDAFQRLIDVCERYQARLVVDISNVFNLSSSSVGNGVFAYLADGALPSHVSLLCGLIHNRVYSDLEIAFLLSENAVVLDAMANSAELTYSRTSIFAQEYYNNILFDLLNFHVKNFKREKAFVPRFPVATSEQLVIDADVNIKSDTIRLDYGENALAAPAELKSALLEGFVSKNIASTNLEHEIAINVRQRFNLSAAEADQVVIGNGIAPLFAAIAAYCAKQQITLVFPTGAYGYFVAAAKFYNAPVVQVATSSSDNFKMTASLLNTTLQTLRNHGQAAVVFLNAPIVNPTGAIYSVQELQAIIGTVNAFHATVVVDTVFAGLEHATDTAKYDFSQLATTSAIILGGISKEMAGAGMRLGFGYTTQPGLLKILRPAATLLPSPTRFAAAKIYALFNKRQVNLLAHLSLQRNILTQRAQLLVDVLSASGWTPIVPAGGLFLIATPDKILGNTIEINGSSITITADNIHVVLFEKVNLLVNSAQWIGIPAYCRFVLSVSEDVFQAALEKLKLFWRSLAHG